MSLWTEENYEEEHSQDFSQGSETESTQGRDSTGLSHSKSKALHQTDSQTVSLFPKLLVVEDFVIEEFWAIDSSNSHQTKNISPEC
jgi:hypothetical protein